MGTIIFWPESPPQINLSNIKQSALIPYPSEYNFRQTINDCGPFNVAAVIRALTGREISSKKLAETIGWRLPNKYTLPWGIEDQLKSNGINIEIPNIGPLDNNEKLNFLKERLSLNRTIIILGEQDGYQHYITILGFDSSLDEFYIYNSLHEKGEEGLTKDENGSLPGNVIMNSEDIINFWTGGGMYGMYKWYAVAAFI